MTTTSRVDPEGPDGATDVAGPPAAVPDPDAPVVDAEPPPGAPADEAGKPDVHEVRNCTLDHVVVTSSNRDFILSPLGTAVVEDGDAAAFALRDLADQHVVRLTSRAGRSQELEGGLVFGLGFWAVIGYFVALANIEPGPALTIFAVGAPVVAAVTGIVAFGVYKKRLTSIAYGASLFVVVLLGMGIPVGVALSFGHLGSMVRAGASPELFGRLAQTIFIVVASLVPTLLYYLFDRQRVLTIRHNFEQQILRLDPSVESLYDVDAKYGDQLAEAIGGEGSGSERISRSNRFPIFLATALIALAWGLTLPVVDAGGAGDATTVAELLTPHQVTYVFGFLGAYFFAMNLITRRYVRGDLRPKSYGTITVRILTVFLLAWVLDIAFDPGKGLLVTAFLVGILPETFFTVIGEARRAVFTKVSDEMREPQPLTRLEGIDLYDRARLQDEGVNNVEALAHHDLVDLMLSTRIPVPRLVDWVDQAILYLHTVDENGKSIGRDHLRAHGIRTASDLLTAQADPRLWSAVTGAAGPGSPAGPWDVVHAAIADEEWMVNILEWRRASRPRTRRFTVVDGRAVPVPDPAPAGPAVAVTP
jgi:hypothetical protein